MILQGDQKRWIAPLLALAALGCGEASDNRPREPISGEVTLEGQPMNKGFIQFMPMKPEQATAAAAEISKGAFKIPKSRGLVPGGYSVRIYSTMEEEAAAPEGLPGPETAQPPPPELIPAKYNSKSTLTAEVKAGEKNEMKYELKMR